MYAGPDLPVTETALITGQPGKNRLGTGLCLAKIPIWTPPSIGSRGGESNVFGTPISALAVVGRDGDRAGATRLGVGRAWRGGSRLQSYLRPLERRTNGSGP